MVKIVTIMRMNHHSMFLVLLCIMLFSGNVEANLVNQVAPTATAVPVSLPTPLPIVPTDAQNITSSSSTRTPTPEGSALLEAITEANVRSEPDPESDRLGTIRMGDTYVIIGRYFQWYQFQYDQSPSGIGWVFSELVNVSGNTNRIPDLALGTATPDVNSEQIIATLGLLTQTPGGVLTATAAVGVIPLPVEPGGNNTTDITNGPILGSATPLPTFTIPPDLSISTSQSQSTDNILATNVPEGIDLALPSRIPPILPILFLGGFGILGLLVSSMRK